MRVDSVLVIDDHAMFRCGLCMMLNAHMPDALVFEANSLNEATQTVLNAPTLILLDIELQGLNGLECIAVLKSRWPQTFIIMLSSHTNPTLVRQSIARGASAFVGKADTAGKLTSAINAVLRQGSEASPVAAGAPEQRARLTPRQLEVLDLLSQGLPNKTIGKRLGLSENTVHGHVQPLLAMLQVSSRSEAVFVARAQGLIS